MQAFTSIAADTESPLDSETTGIATVMTFVFNLDTFNTPGQPRESGSIWGKKSSSNRKRQSDRLFTMHGPMCSMRTVEKTKVNEPGEDN